MNNSNNNNTSFLPQRIKVVFYTEIVTDYPFPIPYKPEAAYSAYDNYEVSSEQAVDIATQMKYHASRILRLSKHALGTTEATLRKQLDRSDAVLEIQRRVEAEKEAFEQTLLEVECLGERAAA